MNASPPRTAIVSDTGGRSQLTGLVAAAIVLALLAFGATLLRHVPHAALGGVLLFVALRIIRVRQIVAIYRQSFGEFLLIVSTTAAIIVLPIEQGVAIGIALSLLNGIWSTTRARVLVFERVPGTSIWWPPSPHMPGRERAPRHSGGISGALVFSQRISLPARHPGRLAVLDAEGAADRPRSDGHSRDRLHRRPGSERPHSYAHADGVAFAIARLESIRAQDAVVRFGSMSCWDRVACSAAWRRLSGRFAAKLRPRTQVRLADLAPRNKIVQEL